MLVATRSQESNRARSARATRRDPSLDEVATTRASVPERRADGATAFHMMICSFSTIDCGGVLLVPKTGEP